MYKTIEEINLALSTLRVTFSKDDMDPFNIVNETLKAFPSIARIENPNAIEYKCGAEQFIIKLTEEDRIAIQERYCLGNTLVSSFETLLRLEDSKKTESGYSVYKFVDVTPKRQNT
jgi:hypothetical protein